MVFVGGCVEGVGGDDVVVIGRAWCEFVECCEYVVW